MKKALIAILSAVVLTACGGSGSLLSGGTKMDTAEATQQVIDCLKKNIDVNEWKVYKIRWTEGEELENNLFMVSVEMINKSNDCFTQNFQIGGSTAGHVSDLKKAVGMGVNARTFEAIKGISFDSINPEAIQKQYESAKATIPAEYDFKSISGYIISEEVPSGNNYLDSKKSMGQTSAEFSINTTERGKEYVESAGKKSLQYYDATFNVMPDGSVEIDQ